MNLDSIQIHLNSKYADSYNNNNKSDCQFNLPLIELPMQNYIYLSVQSATIPYTWYNIDSTNNKLIYTLNGEYNYLEITKGNYNSIQLAIFLTNAMNGFVVSYSVITNKITFTHSTYNFVINNTSSCLGILGFPSVELYQTSILQSLTSYTMMNLLNKSSVYIQTNLTTGNINNNKKSTGNILCCIPISAPPYSLISYVNTNSFRSNLYVSNINNINIRIVDENNDLIDLNGCEFSITLQIDAVNFFE